MNDSQISVKNSTALGEKYYLIKHKSGLDIYVVPKELSTSYALFGVKYGSVINRFTESGKEITVPDGIAHFLEHKMFEGKDGEDAFNRFSKTGASANAFTGFNSTAYLFSSTENFYESLEILLDFVSSPYFTKQTVKKEQGIIGQEIRMGEDSPDRALVFGLLEGMYKNNNVRTEIAGTVESIAEITPELLYSCYRRFYNLRNMALCVAGDVDPEKISEVADRILTEAPPFEVSPVQLPEPDGVLVRRGSTKMQISMPMFALGVKDNEISAIPAERLKKGAAMGILANMLFGKSSSLYNDLYSDGTISSDLDIWCEHNRDFSFITLSGYAADPDSFFEKYYAYIEELKKSGLSQKDFERCRRVHYAGQVRTFDSSESIASAFLDCVFEGSDLFEYIDISAQLDFDYISKLFVTLFGNTDNTAEYTVLPR